MKYKYYIYRTRYIERIYRITGECSQSYNHSLGAWYDISNSFTWLVIDSDPKVHNISELQAHTRIFRSMEGTWDEI